MSKLSEKWDRIEDNPVIMVEELRNVWAEEATEFMEDEDYGKVLDIALRFLSGEVPDTSKIPLIMVKLEAHSIKFRVQFAAYMGFQKGTKDANMKKNMYKELYTGTDRLVDALKYMVR